jgi:glycosyltransferase involved in cell wall biosynthesis
MISVILPVYNGEKYIREALRSVQEQEAAALEILVIDDGSTDGIAGILAREFPSIYYHPRPHTGLPATRNAGLELATGEWLGFLDADDLWVPGKLRLQMDFLSNHPDVEAVFGHIRQFYTPEDADQVRGVSRYAQEILPGYHPDTMLIRAEAMRRVGKFNPAVEMGEFLDWFARAQEAGLRYAMLPDVLALRRIHAGNMSVQRRSEAAPGYARLLKDALDRRRNSGS